MTKSADDLARTLEVPLNDLRRYLEGPRSALYRYQRRPIGKKIRLLRIPRPYLRRILDLLKERLLDPMHLPPTMHGWRKGHSPKSYVRPHVRRSFTLNADIQDFFPSVSGARVHAFWLREGFTPEASKILTALTVCDNQLPQGSPTSQAIGNQILIRLDRRLNRLAAVNGSNFSMYGDEFTISGRRRVKRLEGLAIRIVEQEGFTINPKKVKKASRSEKQEIAGIVVNKKLSLGKEAYRELRAIVHNCLKYGPESQNKQNSPTFRRHLRGRIAHFQQVNPNLGSKLLSEFEKVIWS